MYIIEISEDKVSHLADTIGKMLHYGGKAMECIEELREGDRHDGRRIGYRDDDDRMNERSYGRGGRYGMRGEDRDRDEDRMDERDYGRSRHYKMRDEDRDGDEDRMDERYRLDERSPYMGERRGRSASTGRYVRR